jgi:hypothetical protein
MVKISYLQAYYIKKLFPETKFAACVLENTVPSKTESVFKNVTGVWENIHYWISDTAYEALPDEVKNAKLPSLKKELAPVQVFNVPVLCAKTNKVITFLVMAETLDEAKQSVLSVHGKDVQRLVE